MTDEDQFATSTTPASRPELVKAQVDQTQF
jgi:hypothetical protein